MARGGGGFPTRTEEPAAPTPPPPHPRHLKALPEAACTLEGREHPKPVPGVAYSPYVEAHSPDGLCRQACATVAARARVSAVRHGILVALNSPPWGGGGQRLPLSLLALPLTIPSP